MDDAALRMGLGPALQAVVAHDVEWPGQAAEVLELVFIAAEMGHRNTGGLQGRDARGGRAQIELDPERVGEQHIGQTRSEHGDGADVAQRRDIVARREQEQAAESGCSDCEPRAGTRQIDQRTRIEQARVQPMREREQANDDAEHAERQGPGPGQPSRHLPVMDETRKSGGEQDRDAAQFRQQVIGLLAADHRKADKYRRQPAGQQAHARMTAEIERAPERLPGARPQQPGQQQGGNDRGIPPPRPRMIEAVDHATGGLHEEQFIPIGLAAGHAGCDSPGDQHGTATEHGDAAAEIPARAPTLRPGMPERAEQEGEQHVQEHDRTLAHQAGGHGEGESEEPWTTLRIAPDQGIQRGQHAQGQQHFVHDLQAEQEGIAECGEQPGRQLGDQRQVAEQDAREAPSQQQDTESERHLEQARPDIADPADRPAEVDQPEQQRHLVAVRLAVAVRNEELTTVPHLPGDAERARRVERHETGLEDRDQRSQQPQRRP